MTLQSLPDLKAEVMRLAALIDAVDAYYVPNFGGYKHGGDDEYCVELDDDSYHYFYIERGQKRTEIRTRDLDELLYHIFQPITHQLASRYAQQHRIPNQDFRRSLFQKQEELMAVLSPQWADKTAKEHNKILQSHPYNDMQ